ncbi:MAG: L-seryl-tRNA(Sec) selenium transferase, partial [Gemmatimonadota bacterium]|nr:L-seryl-tRNA(Sec) selenium transferase [Gemmatimonadota bacterium]
MAEDPRRSLPGVDRLLDEPWCLALQDTHGRPLVTRVVRSVLADLRKGVLPTPGGGVGYQELVSNRLAELRRPGLVSAINATGVVLHTNLGRAPLADAARRAMERATGYGNLEFDLATGKRGSRYAHCVPLIRELTGAEDALVVNNCAAAVALALTSHARGGGVAVSHGELVEIGGGFRIPEVVESAGASLVAVGTTNRTRLADYERVL